MTRSLSLATRRYSIEPRKRKYVKGYGFLSLGRSLSNKYSKQLLYTGLDCLKTAPKNVVYKISEFLENKIAEVVAKSYDDKIVKTKPVEKIIIPSEKEKKYQIN